MATRIEILSEQNRELRKKIAETQQALADERAAHMHTLDHKSAETQIASRDPLPDHWGYCNTPAGTVLEHEADNDGDGIALTSLRIPGAWVRPDRSWTTVSPWGGALSDDERAAEAAEPAADRPSCDPGPDCSASAHSTHCERFPRFKAEDSSPAVRVMWQYKDRLKTATDGELVDEPQLRRLSLFVECIFEELEPRTEGFAEVCGIDGCTYPPNHGGHWHDNGDGCWPVDVGLSEGQDIKSAMRAHIGGGLPVEEPEHHEPEWLDAVPEGYTGPLWMRMVDHKDVILCYGGSGEWSRGAAGWVYPRKQLNSTPSITVQIPVRPAT